jgi:hypothetical protein
MFQRLHERHKRVNERFVPEAGATQTQNTLKRKP